MFQLTLMSDMVRVIPSKFHLPLEQAITEELNRKFSDKVVLNVGLCICLYNIESIGASYIIPGDGSSHTRTKFTFVVFRPHLDELIQGVVKASSPKGLQVCIDFFDAIFIRPDKMLPNSRFDESENTWVWDYEENSLHIDIGAKIQIQVVEEQFSDSVPSEADKTSLDDFSVTHPYTVLGTICSQGLGLLRWWDEEEDEQETEEEGVEVNGEHITEENPEQLDNGDLEQPEDPSPEMQSLNN